jgi:hypothetical protein
MRKLVLPVFALAVSMFAGSAALTADDKAEGESHDHHAAYDACAKACSDCSTSPSRESYLCFFSLG